MNIPGKPLFPPEKLVRYPHLMVGDVEIWERYLELHAKEWTGFRYDVRVGEGIELPKSQPEYIRGMALALTEKRIDVVGEKGNDVWIIEVKPNAMLSAVGQVLSYQVLFEDRFPEERKPYLMIVTDRKGPDIDSLCQRFNISLVVV